MTRFVAAVALCAALALASLPARADEPKRLTNDELVKMLTKLGYETKILDKTFTQVLVDRPGGGGTNVRTSLSTGGTSVWVDAWFVAVRPDDVPAATWRKLLEQNDILTPAAFTLNPKNNRVYLSVSFPNADLTPAELRRQLEAFDAMVEKTQDVWKLSNFVPPATAAGEKELAALSGTWAVTEMSDEGKELAADEAAKYAYKFDKGRYELIKDGKVLRSGLLVADPDAKQPRLDRYDASAALHGVYTRDGDTLTWCYTSGTRPTKFAGDAKTATSLLVLKRQK